MQTLENKKLNEKIIKLNELICENKQNIRLFNTEMDLKEVRTTFFLRIFLIFEETLMDMSKNHETLANKTKELETLNSCHVQKLENFERKQSALEVENMILKEKLQEIEELKMKEKLLQGMILNNKKILNDFELDLSVLRQSKENLDKIEVIKIKILYFSILLKVSKFSINTSFPMLFKSFFRRGV